MTIRTASTAAALALCCLNLAPSADAAPLRTSYTSCEAAIADRLGDGRLRNDLVKAHQSGGEGTHWINVRHRGTGADETTRLRALCETTSNGDVAALSLDSGRWKAQRANRPPVATD